MKWEKITKARYNQLKAEGVKVKAYFDKQGQIQYKREVSSTRLSMI